MIKKFVLIVLIFSCLKTYAVDSLKSVDANYIFYYKNMAAGTMNLKINNENNSISASTIYDGNFIASLVGKGKRTEEAYLEIKNSKIVPIKYKYQDNKDLYEIIFNDSGATISSKSKDFHLPSKNIIYDPVSLLVVLMNSYPNINKVYSVVSKKQLKEYSFTFKDNINYSIGENNYNVFSAEYNRGKKTNYYFFSKDHKNLPVSIMIKKDGKEKIRIDLFEIKYLD